MALINCTECNKEVSDQAKTCPSCGAKVVKPKPAKQKTSPIVKFVAIAAGLGIVATIAMSPPKTEVSLTPAQKAEKDKQAMLTVLSNKCAQAITASLKFPEGAEIPNANHYDDADKFFSEEKDGVYRVQVKFKARNGFNALSQSVVECKWKQSNGDYEPIGGLKKIQ